MTQYSGVRPETRSDADRLRKTFRLALTMCGGVSLAVRIGGAVAEIDLFRRPCKRMNFSPDPHGRRAKRALIYRRLLGDTKKSESVPSRHWSVVTPDRRIPSSGQQRKTITAQHRTKTQPLTWRSLRCWHPKSIVPQACLERSIAAAALAAPLSVAALLTPMSAQAQPAATIPGDGVYVVGVDIQPGTYVSSNPGYCSWYRLSGLSGDSRDIIASDNTASGKMYVTIAPTDAAFKTLSCSTWQLVSASTPSQAVPAPPPEPPPQLQESSVPGPNFLTQSHRVVCAVTPDSTLSGVGPDAVVCQGHFTQPGAKFNAVTTGTGSFYWEDANLAVDNPTTKMVYGQTYHRGNWTIYHDASGTRFTNDRTGHGMFVSIENVYAF
jgi:hypothetical protein